ncbi:zinc knuckle CX2CX4HX4C containing protein, partial [Tanacetum coccineum]
TGSLPSGHVDLTGDEDPTDEDGDNDMGDPTRGSVSLGDSRSVPHGAPDASHENSLQSQIPEKSWGSNSGDDGNTGDKGNTVGGAIGTHGGGIGDSLLVALYACMTFIYGSSWKGEIVSEAERSLGESSEGSEEVFPGEAGEGCVDAAVRTDDGGVKGLKSPLTTKDNDHAAACITSVCENAIPAVIVGIENICENSKNGGLGTKIIPTAACIDKKDTTCGSNNTPFADLLTDKNPQQTVYLTEQNNEVDIVGANVAIPQATMDMISARFDNTLYGYFIGKLLAFPVVENYVKHVWAKYGLERVMLHQGFFLFKFSSKDGMDSVMKNGPWRIRLVPILLNVWNAEEKVKKEDIKRIHVWVKLFNVPIVAYSEIGLSLITSKLGRLIMLDAHTSSMCLNSWGLSSYARALVKIIVDLDLVESLAVAIPT